MYNCVCALVAIFLTFNASAALTNLEKGADKIAGLESEIFFMERLWERSVSDLISLELAPQSEQLNKIKSLNNFLKLGSSERQKIIRNHAVLERVLKVCAPNAYEKLHDKIENELKQIQKLRTADAVRKSIVKYQNRRIDIRASAIDHLLGVRYEFIESKIETKEPASKEYLYGMSKFYSQTDYRVIRNIYETLQLEKGDVVYDLGSGYGRFGLYGGILRSDVQFKGVEIVEERVAESNKIVADLQLKNVNFYAEDVLKYNFSDGNVFFLYNPFPSLLDQVLEQIKTVAKKKKITIVAVGSTVSELRYVEWLTLKNKLQNQPWVGSAAVYQSK